MLGASLSISFVSVVLMVLMVKKQNYNEEEVQGRVGSCASESLTWSCISSV